MTEDKVIEWFAAHGLGGYRERVVCREALINELKGDAGRYWAEDEKTVALIAQVEADIAEIKREAFDRYEDWKTDPLP